MLRKATVAVALTATITGALPLIASSALAQREQRLGLIQKMTHRFKVWNRFRRAKLLQDGGHGVARHLTGQHDGAHLGMKGLLGKVRQLAFDRGMWSEARYIRASYQRHGAQITLLGKDRKPVGTITVDPSGAISVENGPQRGAFELHKTPLQATVQASYKPASGPAITRKEQLRLYLNSPAVLLQMPPGYLATRNDTGQVKVGDVEQRYALSKGARNYTYKPGDKVVPASAAPKPLSHPW